jgi:pyruvate/oxaloacetate carboxyltransferase
MEILILIVTFTIILGILIPPMVFKTFSTQEITSIINSVKTKNSSGYDEISTKLLKISANYICSKSMSTGIFPERLKYSIIKSLYKETRQTHLTVDQYQC